MASLILSKFATPAVHKRSQFSPPLSSSSSATSTSTQLCSRHHRRTRGRGLSMVTRAVPGTNTYIFAFVFPLSLIAATIFTSIQIADKLDRDYYEELLAYKEILDVEANDDDDDDDDEAVIFADEEPERPRSRNRPTREAEV